MTQAKKIIVVDDDVLITEAMKNMLMEIGLNVLATAESAAEARTLLESHSPDVLMLDIMMPGESGLSLLKDVREKYPDIRVLMMS
ncbi:MAG: response regulator, partial [Gammaproteobacteria bacterium]|nr:response regulator [Gammaproteobacteria bacterium]